MEKSFFFKSFHRPLSLPWEEGLLEYKSKLFDFKSDVEFGSLNNTSIDSLSNRVKHCWDCSAPRYLLLCLEDEEE